MINFRRMKPSNLEHSFYQKIDQSIISQSLKSSQVIKTRLSFNKQPRSYFNHRMLQNLSEWNEVKKYQKQIKYCVRSRSSEGNIDGIRSKKQQQIFLLLPYHCPLQLRKLQCKRMWKRLIMGVEEQLLTKTASCPSIPPRKGSLKSLNYPSSPPKRKFRSRTQGEGKHTPKGFGEYLQAMYENEKYKKEQSSKYLVSKEFKSNDSRIKRLMTSRIQDQTLDISRNRCGSINNAVQLPPIQLNAPYKDENNRIKRVSSTLIRRIRTLRQY